MKSASSSSEISPPTPPRPEWPRRAWWPLVLLLIFGLLAWGVWWYFDYKIQSLDAGMQP